MNLAIAWRLARRELRGGVRGFGVFLACLALGVAAIAAVGSVRASLQDGLRQQGATLLGGDAEIELTYRYASEAELAWMTDSAVAVSEIVDFRSMLVVGSGDATERALTQVKAVDDAYPLIGAVELDPPIALKAALAGADGVPGIVLDRVLIERLGLSIGDTVRLGSQDFVLTARIVREPDSTGGFSLGPRSIVRTSDLATSGLLAPGTLFETAYRMRLRPGTIFPAMRAEADEVIDGGGFRWRDSRNGAPGLTRFVNRLSTFLVLVGLAGLAVGGIGISAAVRSYLTEKIPVIATLKTLGADGRLVMAIYFLQIGVLTTLGIVAGLAIGALAPILLAPVIEANLPIPVVLQLQPQPLIEAAWYGALAATLFALWPLARTENIRAAALFRDANLGLTGSPRRVFLYLTAGLLVLLIGSAAWLTGQEKLTIWAAGGMLAAFLTLLLAAAGVRYASRLLSRRPALRRMRNLRAALASVGGPGGEATSVVLSLGLGLSVLAAIGQIDSNLRGAIARDLPEVAPSFFMLDIQPNQLDGFNARLTDDPAVSRVETAPMLRGIITRINGRPAREVVGGHWVISGDRGITYSDAPPAGADITAGQWWPEDYAGPPQISFAAEEAEEMGLKLGDEMTVNVLGRDITGEITSFRDVDFSDAGMGFVLSMNPAAISAAPHTVIATIYADETAEAAILRDLATAYPNITAIPVKDAIDRFSTILKSIAAAITYAALAALTTGLVVLIGAAAAGERARTFEAAVLKTLGAARASILVNFSLRSAILGMAAGLVAVVAGGLAGWAVMTFVMEGDFRFDLMSAVLIVLCGIGLTVAAGALFSMRSLRARPAAILRAQE